MHVTVFLVTALTLSALLLGCARQPATPEDTEPAPQEEQATQAPEAAESTPPEVHAKQPVRPFSSETLYALLAAELAGARERFDVALSNYLQQAHETRDPQVAARATRIARFLSADQATLDAALLWVDVAPEDSEAQLQAALALVQNGRLKEAFKLSRQLHEKGEHTLFQNIAASASEVTDTQREQLLEGFLSLLEEHPEHRELLVGTGLLYQQQQELETALDYAERALSLHPDNESARVLKATLLNQLERSEEALAIIEAGLEDKPQSKRLRLQYARLLTQHDLERAQTQFEQLVERDPGNLDLRLSLGIVAFERGDNETAREQFRYLLDQDQHRSSANFYLGRMAEHEGQTEDAILYYLQVEPGSDFLQATINLLDLFYQQGDLAAADDHMDRLREQFPDRSADLYLLQAQALRRNDYTEATEVLLGEALGEHPEHSDLRYTRAMLYDRQDRLEAAEADLRRIIKYDPHNAAALNALGYILTDNTDRHEEAHELIRQALALEPDEPAIQDSMGWVLYKLGRPREALEYLEKAMQAYPDQEIAAHLGEVLWQLGEKERAREVWQRGLEADPDSELIPATKRRLQVPE